MQGDRLDGELAELVDDFDDAVDGLVSPVACKMVVNQNASGSASSVVPRSRK
jgi:hypothetical protein